MSPSRQERRRDQKKKMQPASSKTPTNRIKIPLCYPGECTKECDYRTFGKENDFHDYDEILKKYLLLSHGEKRELPDGEASSIEIFSRVFCPPDTMVAYEKEVQKQAESFFKEIHLECDEFGGGAGFFFARATITKRGKRKNTVDDT